MIKNVTVIDIDGVICDFVTGIIKSAQDLGFGEDFPKSPADITSWGICDKFGEVFDSVKSDDNFWLNLPLLNEVPKELEVDYYLTARPCKSEVSARWIEKMILPQAEVITTATPLDKIPILKNLGATLFIDDHYKTIIEARLAGINAFLFAAPYQRGHKLECDNLPTIKSLEEIITILER
jgi:uncharacterized HAD superfamily protein